MDVTRDAVENLVTQFSSALDFYRELVQNSIDAGTSAVEIWTEYLEPTGGDPAGAITIHVDDFGEGMNESIIDEQLTTLFSSTKEDDLTKIGKFGIGFVSVFAIKPKAVLVHTGRGGEYWEVMFHEDRSFQKSRVPSPVEGTQITLFVAGDRAQYRELVTDSRRVLTHWCSHSEVEVTFEDRSDSTAELEVINQRWAVEGECMTEVTVEGTEMVLAFSRSPVFGFFNKGLALALVRGESDLVPARLRHVAFKIKSRYLEHTLSRETVMRDANYDKAMRQLAHAADGPLRSALVAKLVDFVSIPGAWTVAEMDAYLGRIEFLVREGRAALDEIEDQPLLRVLDGRAVTLEQVSRAAAADGHVFVLDQASPLGDALMEQGAPVLLDTVARIDGASTHGGSMGPVAKLVVSYLHHRRTRGLMGQVRGMLGLETLDEIAALVVNPEAVIVSLRIETDRRDGAVALVAAAERVLARAFERRRARFMPSFAASAHERSESPMLGYGRLACCSLEGDGGVAPLFVIGRKVGPIMALPPPGRASIHGSVRPEAAVNRDHPHFRELLRLWADRPALAAYCLAKDVLLAEDRMLDKDSALMAAAHEVVA